MLFLHLLELILQYSTFSLRLVLMHIINVYYIWYVVNICILHLAFIMLLNFMNHFFITIVDVVFNLLIFMWEEQFWRINRLFFANFWWLLFLMHEEYIIGIIHFWWILQRLMLLFVFVHFLQHLIWCDFLCLDSSCYNWEFSVIVSIRDLRNFILILNAVNIHCKVTVIDWHHYLRIALISFIENMRIIPHKWVMRIAFVIRLHLLIIFSVV